MTDTPKKSAGSDGVNRVPVPDVAEPSWEESRWDVPVGCLDPATGEDLRHLEVNQPLSYWKLSEEKKAALQTWILEELCHDDETGPYSSYGLKHLFEESPGGFYVTNGQFIGAMFAAGYLPKGRHAVNWTFGYRVAKGEFAKRRSA